MYCIALYCIILHCIVNKAKYHFKTVLSWQDIMVFLLYQIGKKYNRFRKKNYNIDNNNKKKNNNNNNHNHNNKIFIMRMKYKGKQKQVKKEMSDLQTEIPMIFISIILTVQLHFSFD